MQINTVMLVDDEEDIRVVAELSLSQVGQWKTIVADSGTTALEMAATHQPDVILLDVMMPGMDGPQTLQQLRQQDETKHIPVIFLTAKVQPREVNEYLELGASGVVAKPFDPMSLPNEIRSILNAD